MERKAMSISEIASALSRARWDNAPTSERERMGKLLAKSRKRIPKAKRSELASNAASSISPEAASNRARKAWETKKKKAAAKKKSAA